MKTIQEFKQRLITLNSCKDARDWAYGKTAAEAWEQCERGDWLLWWAKKENADLRQLTLAKARCAKLVIHLMKDERSIKAVEAAENFGLGLIDLEELNAYAADAYAAAAYAAAADAYADAAYAAAAYADAAYAAADAAYADAAEAAYAKENAE